KSPQNSSRHSRENLPSSCNNNSATCISPNTPDDCSFTKGEAATVIHHLSKGKAPGPDEHHSVGNIVLFHKPSKSKTEVSSYQPISMLQTIGKVLETLLTQRRKFHLEKNNRLSNLQYGFRERKSAEMAITKLLDSIQKGKASGDHVLLLSSYIKGAFDNIQQNAIVSFLDNSKCPENIISLKIFSITGMSS
ncbi:hypothetical protein AVEN_197675-1, partial [Araneus ventricosus]